MKVAEDALVIAGTVSTVRVAVPEEPAYVVSPP